MIKRIILLIICFSLLIGCSSSPKDVRKEIYSRVVTTVESIEKAMENGELISDHDQKQFENLYNKYIGSGQYHEDLTEKERELLEATRKFFEQYFWYYGIRYTSKDLESAELYKEKKLDKSWETVKILLDR